MNGKTDTASLQGDNKHPVTGPWDTEALDQQRAWDAGWTQACLKMTTDPWTNGILPLKEVELICVAVNAACTNLQAAGVRRHIRAALAAGATQDEILDVDGTIYALDAQDGPEVGRAPGGAVLKVSNGASCDGPLPRLSDRCYWVKPTFTGVSSRNSPAPSRHPAGQK